MVQIPPIFWIVPVAGVLTLAFRRMADCKHHAPPDRHAKNERNRRHDL